MVKISVIIPAFNEEKYIGRALRSILDQSFNSNNYEVIVVNDNSSDKTEYAISLFGNAVSLINNKKNIGLPASLNKAIKKSKGQYIVRLDADDYVNRDYLLFLYRYLKHNQEYDAASCDYYLVDNDENIISRESALISPIGCGIIFNKEKLYKIGLYDESFRYHEDKDLRIRFEKNYKIIHLSIPLYRYRRHEQNITNNKHEMESHHNKLKHKHNI